MKHERATEEIREQAALYALGSLTQHEARSFEVHMSEGCSVCETEFRRYEHIVAGMGFAAGEAAPPEYVRDLLLARIEREHLQTATAQKKTPEPELPPPMASVPEAPKPIFAQPPARRSVLFPWVLALLFAAAALCMYFVWKSARDSARELQTDLSAAAAELSDSKALQEIQKRTIEEFDQVLSIANKPGTKISRLAGPAASPSAAVTVLWDGPEGRFLAFGALPPAPEGKVYQLWFFSQAARIPAGLLKLNPSGRFFVSEPIPPDAVNATAAALTLEPDNGSQIPTLPFFAVSRIAN